MLGLEHLEVAKTQNNMGEVFRKQAKYPEAFEMFQKSLATKEKVLGLEHPRVADTKVGQLFDFFDPLLMHVFFAG